MGVIGAPARAVRFAGYASVFHHRDRGGDVVTPGAFRQSLKRNQKVPLLWQHQPGKVIGTIERLAEDERGLQVIGRLHDDAFGRALGRELNRGTLSGLSFGYRVAAARQVTGHRALDAVEILEISLVRNPMQPLARVHRTAE